VFATLLKDVHHAAVLRAERAGRALEPALLLVLDEAANIAPVRDLDELAATASSHGIQLVTVFQDLAQVKARYGHRAHTILNNHRAKLLLPGTADPELLDHVTRLAGERRERETTHSTGPGGHSHTTATRHRPLAPAHELRQLPRDRGVLLYGNLPPIKVTLRPWYRDRRLRRLHDAAGGVT
jgi:type IV secretion system protein VirD4